MMRTVHTFVLLMLGYLLPASSASADDLTVLPASKEAPASQTLRRQLRGMADEAFTKRRAAYEAVETAEQVTAHQARLRQAFLTALGPMPARTPLHAKLVRTIQGEGYRVELVTFESQPGHVVTANVYVPASGAESATFPAVLVPCGHSQSGKAAQQSICLPLVKAGFIAMSYDPIGQGERFQLLDSAGKPAFGMTTEHTLLGASSIPVGRGTATYRIHDGIRAIDYLCERKDVDGKRIGVTGVSGGGTMSSYLMAVDDRIACAAPSCFITSIPVLLQTIGPQDAEQNLFGQIAAGIDHADYMILRAPRPTLVLAGTQDFFNITGTWDSFRQAKRMYTRLDAADRVELVETDTKHGYPKSQREPMVRWMKRWLMGKDEPYSEPVVKTLAEKELLCTLKGQVMLMEGARSVIDLNAALAKEMDAKRRELWKLENREKALAEVRRISGVRALKELPAAKMRSVAGTIKLGGYSIHKFAIEVGGGVELPVLLFQPVKPNGKRMLYLNGAGKHAEAQDDRFDAMVKRGILVMAVDLRGFGELGPAKEGQWGGDWNDIFVSYLLGTSLTALRTEDALIAAHALSEMEGEGKGSPVQLMALGTATPAALHASALERRLFDRVELVNPMPASWMDVVEHPEKGGHLGHVINGALAAYDLTDLAAAVRARPVKE